MWWSWPTLAQVMACCLTASNHYLIQCWLLISEILWHLPGRNIIVNTQTAILYNKFYLKVLLHLLGVNELNCLLQAEMSYNSFKLWDVITPQWLNGSGLTTDKFGTCWSNNIPQNVITYLCYTLNWIMPVKGVHNIQSGIQPVRKYMVWFIYRSEWYFKSLKWNIRQKREIIHCIKNGKYI